MTAKKNVCIFGLLMSLFVGLNLYAQSGPPVKKATLTIRNTCNWEVPVGVGRDVNTWWFDSDEQAKLTRKTIPAHGSVTFTVVCGVQDYKILIFNTTTGQFSYNIMDYKFLGDASISISYDDDKMEYKTDVSSGNISAW